MPTYEYLCTECESQMEMFQKITDDPLIKCPQCGQQTIRRIPSMGIGVSFKGSGFYKTDYSDAKESGSSKESSPVSNTSPKSSECCPCGKGSKCSQ